MSCSTYNLLDLLDLVDLVDLRSMLLRRYIGRRLADYFAQPQSSVVGRSSEAIDFQALWGEWHWRRVHGQLYARQEGQWLTPVELFRPHYSAVVANFCASEAAKHAGPLEIVELGGGRGTNARCLLEHLRSRHPDVHRRLRSYTVVDSSPSLHRIQRELLLSPHRKDQEKGHVEHDSVPIDCVVKDLTDVAESRYRCNCFSAMAHMPCSCARARARVYR